MLVVDSQSWVHDCLTWRSPDIRTRETLCHTAQKILLSELQIRCKTSQSVCTLAQHWNWIPLRQKSALVWMQFQKSSKSHLQWRKTWWRCKRKPPEGNCSWWRWRPGGQTSGYWGRAEAWTGAGNYRSTPRSCRCTPSHSSLKNQTTQAFNHGMSPNIYDKFGNISLFWKEQKYICVKLFVWHDKASLTELHLF